MSWPASDFRVNACPQATFSSFRAATVVARTPKNTRVVRVMAAGNVPKKRGVHAGMPCA